METQKKQDLDGKHETLQNKQQNENLWKEKPEENTNAPQPDENDKPKTEKWYWEKWRMMKQMKKWTFFWTVPMKC